MTTPAPASRKERLAQVTAELEALEERMPRHDGALEQLRLNRLGRLAVQHAGKRDEAREFAGQLEVRVGHAEPGTPEHARYLQELEKQRGIAEREEAACREALREGGFASEAQARAARLPIDELEALEHQVDLFAERYNATLQRYLDLGGELG